MTTASPSSYLFALVDGGGTVPPELGAVRRLVDRGHRVEVLADNSMLEDVRPWRHGRRRGRPHFLRRADAEHLCIARAGLPTFGLGGQPAIGPLGRARDRIITTLVQRQWNKGVDPINGLRKSLGLNPLHDFWDQVRHARKILVLTSRWFDFPAQLPDNVRYVGPVLDDPNWAKGQPRTLPPGGHPVVLVAMSSTFQDQIDCLQRVIDAVATLPIRGIVTAGPALDPMSLYPRANTIIEAAAPHSQVLQQASVVITHSGHGTVVRALAAGVPLVVMPHGRDQADNAVRVTARNAGVSINRKAQPTTIADAVRRVLDNPRYGQAADQLGRSIRRDAASGALVTELETDSAVSRPPSPNRCDDALFGRGDE